MYRLFAGMLATATLCVLAPTLRAADAPKTDAPQGEAGRDEALFTELDKNHDGKLTADEVTADHQRLFERLLRTADTNKDGSLDKDEFLSGMKQRPEGRPVAREGREGRRAEGGRPPEGGFPRPGEMFFRLFDTDHDGTLSEAEIQAAPEALKKLDKNGDGKIQREELGPPPGEGGPQPREFGRRGPDGNNPEGRGPGGPEARGPGGPDGRGPAGPEARRPGGPEGRGPEARGPGGPPSPERFAERMKALDKNGDGKISKDEAEGPLKERFDRIDTNGDGFLDETELKQMRERLRDRPQGRPEARRPGGENDPKPANG